MEVGKLDGGQEISHEIFTEVEKEVRAEGMKRMRGD